LTKPPLHLPPPPLALLARAARGMGPEATKCPRSLSLAAPDADSRLASRDATHARATGSRRPPVPVAAVLGPAPGWCPTTGKAFSVPKSSAANVPEAVQPPRSRRDGISYTNPQPLANRRPDGLARPQVSDRRICRVRKVFALKGAIRTCSGALTGDRAVTAPAILTSPDLARRCFVATVYEQPRL
jgi:hypothetical protein